MTAQFTCQKYPFLRVRHLVFNGGILLVHSEDDAEIVRGVDGFGVYVHEVPINESAQVEIKTPGGSARQGTQTSAVGEIPPEPPDSSVLVPRGAGWYEYQGKKYRKGDLPENVRNLV